MTTSTNEITLSSSAPKYIPTTTLVSYSLKHPTLNCAEIGLKFNLSRQAVRERFNRVSFDPKHLNTWKDERPNMKALLQMGIEEKQFSFIASDKYKIESWRDMADAEKVKTFSENNERLETGQSTANLAVTTENIQDHELRVKRKEELLKLIEDNKDIKAPENAK